MDSRGTAQRAAAGALGVAAALLILELGLRVVVAADPLPVSELRKAEKLAPPAVIGDCKRPEALATLAHIVKPSDRPGLVYELKPNTLTCYRGARHLVNLDGQRARSFEPFTRPKPRDVFRVLLLGDSWAYAQSVEYEASLGAELERRLTPEHPGKRVEVINTGVPGYNTAQQAEYLAARGMSYEPDCIVILFVSNDLGLPFLMLEPRDPLSLRRSYLVESLALLLDRSAGTSQAIPFGMTQAQEAFSNFVGSDELDRVPESYRYMVGVSGYRRALESIADTAKGVPVVNVADYSDVHGFGPPERLDLAEFQRKLGIHHLAVPIFRDPVFWVAPDDGHPNARGHADMARQVIEFFKARRLCVTEGSTP